MLAVLASVLGSWGFAETKVLQNFNLIDGTGKPLAPNMAMVIVDGKIQSIGPNLRTRVPSGADVIDMTGKFIMPGIINVHGHVGLTKGLDQDPSFYSRDIIEDNLKTYAAYGVTTVVSLGTDLEAIYPVRNAQRGTRPTMARVYTAGKGFAMRGVNPPGPVRYEVLTPTDVEVKMAEHAKNKPDFVKLWMDDNFGRAKTITPELTNAIITSAKKHKLRVAAHIASLAHAKLLINQGLYALAHSVRDQPVDNELLNSMRKHGAWLIPTLAREDSMFMFADNPEILLDPFYSKSAPAGAIDILKSPAYAAKVKNDPDYERWKNMLDMGERNLQKTSEAGVKIGLGTDSGAPGRFPGSFEHLEMDLMADSGLTASQIITIATKNGAEFIGAQDLGTLEPGKWADLIVLNKNPLDNIRNTKSIESVYLAGNKIKSVGSK